jgi:hypothetical protein
MFEYEDNIFRTLSIDLQFLVGVHDPFYINLIRDNLDNIITVIYSENLSYHQYAEELNLLHYTYDHILNYLKDNNFIFQYEFSNNP